MKILSIPNIGKVDIDSGMMELKANSDNSFHVGENGVKNIVSTGDGKVEFIAFSDKTLAYVNSALGYSA